MSDCPNPRCVLDAPHEGDCSPIAAGLPCPPVDLSQTVARIEAQQVAKRWVNGALEGIVSELELLRQADRRDSAKQCYARAIAIVRGKRYDV
jgi:hypothetical protein